MSGGKDTTEWDVSPCFAISETQRGETIKHGPFLIQGRLGLFWVGGGRREQQPRSTLHQRVESHPMVYPYELKQFPGSWIACRTQ